VAFSAQGRPSWFQECTAYKWDEQFRLSVLTRVEKQKPRLNNVCQINTTRSGHSTELHKRKCHIMQCATVQEETIKTGVGISSKLQAYNDRTWSNCMPVHNGLKNSIWWQLRKLNLEHQIKQI
jgi:hypothetical protein